MRKGSSSSCLTSLITVHNIAQPSFLLPILYQTPTLLSTPKTATRLHAARGHANTHDRRRRTFCSSGQGRALADRARRSNNDPISFVDPYYKRKPDALEPQSQEKAARPSTVTASEQAIFSKLLKDISPPTNPELDGEDILDQDELISGYDPNTDLDNIFEEAIRQLRTQEERTAKSAARNLLYGAAFPRPRAIESLVSDREQALSARLFKRPLKLANGTTLGDEVENDEELTRLEVACNDHRGFVIGMLDTAKTDVEIWQVLEKEVFTLITQLDEHIKLVEKATELDAAKARKAEAKGKDVGDVKLEKRDLNMKEISTLKLSRTKAIPINNLLSILYKNYTEYCLHALRLFRRKHPMSFYGPQVLATIKRQGPISYVLGVSTDIYNEILFLQWTQYSDLHGMADTIEEMINQGIEANEVTIALIKGIAKQRRMGQRGFSGPVLKEWWAMRGNVEGWTRIFNLFARIVSALSEKVAKVVDEEESEDEELEIDKE